MAYMILKPAESQIIISTSVAHIVYTTGIAYDVTY